MSPAIAVRALARFLFAAMLCAYFSVGGGALAQGPGFLEMHHKSWTARDGAPQGVKALAQAPDGILWIGTVSGLFSFDGLTFSAFQPRDGEPDLPAGGVETLLAARDGAVWVGFSYGGVALISHGHVKLFTQADQLRLTSVQRIRQSSDGGVWALHRQRELIRFGADGAWHVEPNPLVDPGPRIYNIFIDSSNTLWIAQGGRLYRRPLNQSRYFGTEASVDWLFGVAEAPDHSIWLSDTITSSPKTPIGRTQHVDPQGKLLARLSFNDNIQDLLLAPDGSLIMITYDEGVLRFSAPALTGQEPARTTAPDDKYQRKDGLSSNTVGAVLVDVDGNLWTGGRRGLDEFRRARLVPFVAEYGAEGSSRLCAGRDGTVWISADGTKNQLYEKSGVSTKLLYPTGQVYSISCGPDGDTWLLANNGIFNVHADRITTIPSIPGSHPFGIFQIVATPDHVLFASVSGGPDFQGIWRYTRGTWTRLTDAGIPSNPPYTEYVDSQGRLWTGNRDGSIGLPLEAGGRLLSSGHPGLGIVFAILETSHGLVAAGLNGLAVLRDDRFEMLNFADGISSRGIGGLVESADGDLWLNASRGIVRIPSAELQAAVIAPHYVMRSELFTEGEFVGPVELKSGRSTAARDVDGNLWFATMNGIFHIDPLHLNSGSRLPNLSIRSLTVDRKPVDNGGNIGPGSEALEIRYLGVNLTAPESVIYKYRLDGLDDAWQDAGHRTQAIYTHLGPGRYTFRVMASNGDGVWTDSISSASFRVLPHIYQTTWFLGLCVAAVLALIWRLYHLRLRQLQNQQEALNQSRLELAHLARLATLSTMTASITHEVSQPISGILTNCDTCARMLAADPPNVKGAAETVRRTIRDADRASAIIKRLRAMFAKRAPAMEMIDLNDAAREVIAMSSAELRRSGAVLQADFAEPLPAISGDRVQLQQVILNLLLNAADAMAGIEDRPRMLRVQTEIDRSDSVKLCVRDSGVGLDPREIEKLFEAFYTTKTHGLGIGLAISRSIIESHNGRLWAMANDGPGAAFGFSIPCARRA